MSRRFENWSGRHAFVPNAWEEPEGEAQVAALVRWAQAHGRRLKVIGAAHSWSDIGVPDDVLVSLDRIAGLRALDPDARLATVGGGTRLRHLLAALGARGFTLPIVGSITEQSISGVIATGTHGSSLVHGNIASFVEGMRLVTGTGEILDLRAGDPRLAAARVGLGALGVITELTLRVEPAFNLCEEVSILPIADAVADLPAIARSAEYVKVWHTPHTGLAQVFRYHRTHEPARPRPLARWIDEKIVNRGLFDALLRLAGRHPAIVPPLNRAIARAYLGPSRRVDVGHRALSLAMPARHRECEYAVALERASEALARTLALIERERIRVNFILEARFVPADDAWMSPAFGRDTCQLGAYMAESPDLQRYFRGFEALMQDLGGRPHWGKELTLTPAQVRARFPMATAFTELRRRLDPDAVFANAFLDRVLGPLH